jgi:hypothetical protein
MIELTSYGQDVPVKGRGHDSGLNSYITLTDKDTGEKVRLNVVGDELAKLVSFINGVPVSSDVQRGDERLMDEGPTKFADGEESAEMASPEPIQVPEEEGMELPPEEGIPEASSEIPDDVFPE